MTKIEVQRTKSDAAPPEVPGVEASGGLASDVVLDHAHRAAIKEYRPQWFVRLMYWLAFQAPFPYEKNEHALKAASDRRVIANLLTKHWFGTELVAPVLDVECDEEGCVFVTRLIEGGPPENRKKARRFLRTVASHFREVGLPTWQINPLNPKAVDNLIETPDGSYRIIDLESGVVSPFLEPSEIWEAVKSGLVPVFDDVFLDKTRSYVHSERRALEESLGIVGMQSLVRAMDDYERHSAHWKRSEPRIWSRLIKAIAS
jgi:hypothetical protein